MFRSRIATLAIAAGFCLVTGCSACSEISLHRNRCRPPCQECERCPAPAAAGPCCCEGPGCSGYEGGGPAFFDGGGPLLDGPGEVMAPVPPMVPGPGGPPVPPDQAMPPLAPPPRLVPEPQAQRYPYNPTANGPRLLGKLDR